MKTKCTWLMPWQPGLSGWQKDDCTAALLCTGKTIEQEKLTVTSGSLAGFRLIPEVSKAYLPVITPLHMLFDNGLNPLPAVPPRAILEFKTDRKKKAG